VRGGRRAAAWLLRLVVVAAVAAVALLPPLSSLEEPAAETARVVDYTAAFDLAADGVLSAAETVVVDLPAGKRGIFRVFDIADPRRDGVDHPVDVVAVRRDGTDEPSVWIPSARGTATLRIGDPSVYLDPGVHTYELRWITLDALEPDPGDDDRVVWWWDVVGSGWRMPIESVTVDAALPAPLAGPVECVQGDDTPCDATVVDGRLRLTTGPLAPSTPVTVRVGFDADALPPPPAGWPVAPALVAGLSAGAVAFVLGLLLSRATREVAPGFPVLFEPPEQAYPALGARVLEEEHGADDLQATLLDLGERGVVRLDGDTDRWTVRLERDALAAGLRPVEVGVLGSLGLRSAGDALTVTPRSTAAGARVAEARSRLRSGVDDDAAAFLDRSGVGSLARLVGAGATLGVVGLTVLYEFSDTGWRSWPLLGALAGLSLALVGAALDPGASTRRTGPGRDLWSRTGGFARFLTTDSAESRFDAAAHLDWYPRYLPWAVALGSADAWARRFEAQGLPVTADSVPYLSWHGPGAVFSASRLGDSFNSTIVAASAAYAASQASSSSGGGGGGFSGGSGGGGGGGGSW
jgi:hypothetical protein